jgi:hypothetical protein
MLAMQEVKTVLSAPHETIEEREFKMSRHRIKRNEFRLANGATVSIEYWIDSTTVYVAAFDENGHQASLAVYQASVDSADSFPPQVQESLIDSLASQLEYDLINNPEFHIRKR